LSGGQTSGAQVRIRAVSKPGCPTRRLAIGYGDAKELKVLRNWQFWLLVALASAAAALTGANMWAFSINRQLQADVNERAQYIQQSSQLEQLAREMANALAQLAARNQDEQVRAMLAGLGVTMAVTNALPAASAPAAGRK
jgi:hypothetical protein